MDAVRLLGASGRCRCRLAVNAGPRSLVFVPSLLAVVRSPDGLAKKAAHEGVSLIGVLPSCDAGRAVLSLYVASAWLGGAEDDLDA